MKRLNITIDDILDDKAIDYCKKNNISKSALIGIALNQYLTAMELMPSVQSQLDELKKQLAELSKVN